MQFSLIKCVNLEASLFIIYLNLNTCKHNIINKSIKVWVYIDIQHEMWIKKGRERNRQNSEVSRKKTQTQIFEQHVFFSKSKVSQGHRNFFFNYSTFIMTILITLSEMSGEK